MSTQLATDKKPQTLRGLITTMQPQFQLALPKHLTAERFTRVAITALTRTPKLQECTPESFMRCLLDLSALGIEPDGRRAHLIPYGKECTLVLDYKGIAELVMRSGLVASIHADKVCENDDFEVNRGTIVCHRIDYKRPRGAAYAYYVLISFKDGSEKSEVMTKDEVEAIRKRSRASGSGPWVTDFDEMGKKTVFRRASKWLPLSPEIRDAMEKDADSLAEESRQASGRVVTDNPMKIANPYKETFADLPGNEPETKPDEAPASHATAEVFAETNPEPQPVAADHGETILEKGETQLQEVNPNAERNMLVSTITAAIKSTEFGTVALFAPRCREAGLLAVGIKLAACPIEDLRTIAANVADIAAGQFIPLD